MAGAGGVQVGGALQQESRWVAGANIERAKTIKGFIWGGWGWGGGGGVGWRK